MNKIKGWFGGGSKKKEETKEQRNPDDESDAPDEAELEKEGFDPDQLEVEEVQEEPLIDFTNDYPGYQVSTKE